MPQRSALFGWKTPSPNPLQVDAAWDAAVAALKGVLEPAFRGATAAPAMLTVKDFILLVCLALGASGVFCALPGLVLVLSAEAVGWGCVMC